MEAANTAALSTRMETLGLDGRDIRRLWHSFNVGAGAFRDEGERHGD
jgi:hypothetical protein